ncbi:hypothetical protein [Flavobacterium tegetincola]|uniref:hypothetical protein n=1 Tax=Flavobacterium tegetincola TaxID=150172 RepID=UPI00047AB77E|nr:hypothetical protein [Flavobacterium tegetincola]
MKADEVVSIEGCTRNNDKVSYSKIYGFDTYLGSTKVLYFKIDLLEVDISLLEVGCDLANVILL